MPDGHRPVINLQLIISDCYYRVGDLAASLATFLRRVSSVPAVVLVAVVTISKPTDRGAWMAYGSNGNADSIHRSLRQWPMGVDLW